MAAVPLTLWERWLRKVRNQLRVSPRGGNFSPSFSRSGLSRIKVIAFLWSSASLAGGVSIDLGVLGSFATILSFEGELGAARCPPWISMAVLSLFEGMQ